LRMGKSSASKNVMAALDTGFNQMGGTLQWFTDVCKGNLTDLRRILHLSLAKGNPK
jgi:hypothetical protein